MCTKNKTYKNKIMQERRIMQLMTYKKELDSFKDFLLKPVIASIHLNH